jgi:hypothetical protein
MNYEVMQMEGNVLKSAAGFKLGFFQQIFFSDHFAFRVDLNNTWSDQSHIKYYSPGTNIGGSIVTGNRDLGNSYINDTSLIFGLTYWH